MRVAVSAKVPNLNSEVDPRFGRCRCFLIVDTETMTFEAIDNAGIAASGGAGIAAAQALLNRDIEAVITGNLGPNAHEVLTQAGIKMFTIASGTVGNAIGTLKSGDLKSIEGPTVASHAGMAAGPMPQANSNPPAASSDIAVLKGRANTMKQQLDNLIFRIEELEKRTV